MHTTKPTLYLTNAASRHHPFGGPGAVYTIMARPRPMLGESGVGSVSALVPVEANVIKAKAGELRIDRYETCYRQLVSTYPLRPNELVAINPIGRADFVRNGDTLICCCSRDKARDRRCHRTWAAELLCLAGWEVVLDGEIFEPRERTVGAGIDFRVVAQLEGDSPALWEVRVASEAIRTGRYGDRFQVAKIRRSGSSEPFLNEIVSAGTIRHLSDKREML